MFNANVGPTDRILRIIVGLDLIALAIVGPHTPWGWIGMIPLATGLFQMCPLYALAGIDTCARR